MPKQKILIEISSNSKIELIKTAYHLGNRHVEVEIEEDILLTKGDNVIQNMLKNFNVDIVNTQVKSFFQKEVPIVMSKSHLLKYLLISPNLPVGGFCYSEGLESYLNTKDFKRLKFGKKINHK